MTVTSVNDKPVADDDDFGVDEDAPATALAVLAGDTDVDGDTLTITAVTQGSKGAVVITGGGTGLTYRPFSNLSGMDSFTYTISDGHGETDTATVTMTIGGENDPPDAVNDLGLHVGEGAGATALDVLANDDDPDGNDLTIKSVTAAAHGTVTITGNGTGLTYRPAKWFHGTDMFTYTVDDGHGATDNATVQVIVDKDVAGPVAVAPLQRFLGPDPRHELGQGADLVVGIGSGLGRHPLRAPGERQRRRLQDRRAPEGRRRPRSTRPSPTAGRTGSGSGPPTTRATPAPTPTARRSDSGSTRSPTRRSRTPRAGARSSARRPSAARRASPAAPDRRRRSHTSATDIGAGRDPHGQQRARRRSTSTGSWSRPRTSAASSTAYRQLIYSRHFADARAHTFEVRAVGDGRVELDAFEILR